ncbi:MAG: arsenate reductase family protein [Nitrospirales bacterium]
MYHAKKIFVKTSTQEVRSGMSNITIYQKPTCSTCREALKLVQASGQPFTAINYYESPFTVSHLKDLLRKAGLKPRDILRTKEDIYKKLGLAKKPVSDDELVALMVKHPDLIQRPLVQKGATVILARPAETVKKLLRI